MKFGAIPAPKTETVTKYKWAAGREANPGSEGEWIHIQQSQEHKMGRSRRLGDGQKWNRNEEERKIGYTSGETELVIAD